MSSHTDIRFQAPGAEGYQINHPAAAHIKVIDAQNALVGKRRKKVAITGFASSTMKFSPMNDPEYEIWGVNQLYRHIPRMDREFDIHRNWREGNVEGTDHPAWIKSCGIPVYMVKTDPEAPTSVRYPIEKVIDDVMGGLDYFTSTIAFMIALAIWEKFETIGVFGVDLIVGKEYEYQKACVEFLLGIAHGRGIHIEVPRQAALIKSTWRYGYEMEPDFGLKLSSMDAWIAKYEGKLKEMRQQHDALSGAVEGVGYWRAQLELRVRGAVPTEDQGVGQSDNAGPSVPVKPAGPPNVEVSKSGEEREPSLVNA